MGIGHKATVTPTKAEMIAAWAPTQPWCPQGGETEVVGSFRLDDPDGRVGMETHLVMAGATLVQVPLTYRDEPLAGAESALIGEMEHSVLGTRWIYDGLGDPRYLLMLAAVSMTGQGEALVMVTDGGGWVLAPGTVRIHGGGWDGGRIAFGEFEPAGRDPVRPVLQNDRFELTVFRQPENGPRPGMGLTAIWDGVAEPVLLAEVRERP